MPRTLGTDGAWKRHGDRDASEEMKVQIDPDRCTGHGRCYSLAPDVFDSDDSGYGFVRMPEVPESLREHAMLAVQNCPEQAISIVDD